MEDVMHLGIHETQIMLRSRTKAIAINLIKNDKVIYIVIQCNSISSCSETWVLHIKQHQSISGAMRLCLIPGAGQPWMPFPLPSRTVPIILKFNWLRLLVAPIPRAKDSPHLYFASKLLSATQHPQKNSVKHMHTQEKNMGLPGAFFCASSLPTSPYL